MENCDGEEWLWKGVEWFVWAKGKCFVSVCVCGNVGVLMLGVYVGVSCMGERWWGGVL